MKKLISFISYHNVVPIAISVLFVGGASAFAAIATGVLPMPAVLQSADVLHREPEVAVSGLLSADLTAFDFHPTVTNVVETNDAYTVSYSLQTLAPQEGAWGPYEKTGEFSVAKTALDETGLEGYVVGKLKDIENGERGYLARAKEAENRLASERNDRPSGAFAALVGLALDQIPVPVVQKPKAETPPSEQPQQEAAQSQPEEQSASMQEAVQTTESATTTEPTASQATSTPEAIADTSSQTSESASATSTPSIPADAATSTEGAASSTPSVQ